MIGYYICMEMVSVTHPVVLLSDQAEELNVGVGELRDGSHAASSTSALERVGSAGSDLLSRQVGQSASVDLDVALHLVNWEE